MINATAQWLLRKPLTYVMFMTFRSVIYERSHWWASFVLHFLSLAQAPVVSEGSLCTALPLLSRPKTDESSVVVEEIILFPGSEAREYRVTVWETCVVVFACPPGISYWEHHTSVQSTRLALSLQAFHIQRCACWPGTYQTYSASLKQDWAIAWKSC